MKVKIVKIPEAQNGVSIPVTSGESTINPVAELEEGEVYKDTQGDILKVSDNAPTHEEGGVLLDDVHKVLEDTGDKRNDEDSKTLLMTPDEVFARTGFRPKRKVTHSKAYELAVDYYDKKFNSAQRKVNTSLKYSKFTNSKASQNSLDLNLKLLESFPTKNELFESIFSHQEELKQREGITPEDNKAQVGIKYLDPNASLGDSNVDVLFGNNFPTAPVTTPTLKDKIKQAVQAGIIELPEGMSFDSIDAVDLPTSESSDREKQGLPRRTVPSTFNQPLTANDLLQPLYSLLTSSKTPVRINLPKVYTPAVRLMNPKPALEAAEASFNRALALLPSNAVGMANMANLYAQKYAITNQTLGEYQNMNNQILNQYDAQIAQARTMQSASDVNLIDQFETKRLTRDEALRQQRMADLGNISDKVALNRRFNREGQYLLNMFPHFDQNAEYNQNQYQFTNPTGNPNTAGLSTPGQVNPFEVQMIPDETGQLNPFVALPTGRGGVSWKRVSFSRNRNFTSTN